MTPDPRPALEDPPLIAGEKYKVKARRSHISTQRCRLSTVVGGVPHLATPWAKITSIFIIILIIIIIITTATLYSLTRSTTGPAVSSPTLGFNVFTDSVVVFVFVTKIVSLPPGFCTSWSLWFRAPQNSAHAEREVRTTTQTSAHS